MTNPFEYLSNILRHPHPCKYLLSRLLLKTGLSKYCQIKAHGYLLHFFPTAISTDLWIDPSCRSYEGLAFLSDGNIVVDIGANVGTTVIPSAQRVGNNGQVYAFEPHPKTFAYLKQNVSLNKLNNVDLFNIAVGNSEATVRISNFGNDDRNRIVGNNEGLMVKIGKLDDFLQNENQIDLLKIDVEGFEKFVLEGATNTLKKTKYILIEISEKHFDEYAYSCQEVLKILEKNEFRLFQFSGPQHLVEISSDYIQKVKNENILAVKNTYEVVNVCSHFSLRNSITCL